MLSLLKKAFQLYTKKTYEHIQKKEIAFLKKRIKTGTLRPVTIDEEGIWFKTRFGFSVYSNLHDRILELDVNDVWEELETNILLKNLVKYGTFFDIGSNLGYFSMVASQLTNNIYAFEPEPNYYSFLLKNIAYNNLQDSIQAFNIAFGDTKGEHLFTAGLAGKSHVSFNNQN